MLTERPLHVDLKDMLLNNEPFSYAHLIKFERPSRPNAEGRISTSKERYVYLTDASRDVDFNDGSTNLLGVANGVQTYIANKVLNVSSVTEQTQAKASNYNITLDGNSLGSEMTEIVTITSAGTNLWNIAWPQVIDLLNSGFREGDKITLSGGFSGSYNIVSFKANNAIYVSKIDDILTTGTGTVTMSLSSEEIKSILLNKNLPDYASFINREVFIYRGYFQEGQIIGVPILLFKGIISNVTFDDTDKDIQVTWGLTSHWGDFAQVKGRITADGFHRALDETGVPQPLSALKSVYAYDKGFTHAETSLNLMAQYTVQVEKQDVKVKKGFLGIGAKVKVKKYFVDEDRSTALDFQLQAKTIPVIYGVRSTPGIPIFADTLDNDSSTVYVIHALAEGELGGLYDVHINGSSLICNDKADFDARSTQTTDNTVELICRGRADRGDVLGGASSIGVSIPNYYAGEDYLVSNINYNYLMKYNYNAYVQPTTTTTDTLGKGVIDGESISLTSPQEITLDFFSGKSSQKAASQLVEIAKANNFKIQKSYWEGTDTAEYWGPNHRLIDTAYVLSKYKIAEGETTIPQLNFVVRGKTINCYNYDSSYSHYTKATSESEANFKLGEFVTLYNMSNVAVSPLVQIIDKWTFMNPDGTSNVRFRFSTNPNLGIDSNGIPSTTKFYMQNASNQTWTMVTWNYEEFNGTVATNIEPIPTAVTNNSGYVAITYSGAASASFGNLNNNNTPILSFLKAGNVYSNTFFDSNRLLVNKSNVSNVITTNIPFNNNTEAAANAAVADSATLVSRDTTRLDSSASATDDYYNGYLITVIKYSASTDKQLIQTKRIVDYVGSLRGVVIDDFWDPGFVPSTGDTVIITPPYCDVRVSTNPAIQTLDYATSRTYGKGLDPLLDLNLSSWLASAEKCDQRSDVTVKYTGTPILNIGSVYRWPSTGDILWQGELIGYENNHAEFTNIIGKLSNNWNSWKNFKINELVYYQKRLYKTTVAGIKTSEPTHTSGIVNGLEYITVSPVLVSTGNPSLNLVFDGNPVRALKNSTIIPGYSLYDCDEINYWRYLGWDEFSQRYVTRHQTNIAIDTSLPLFDNINSMLEHFGGIMTYISGKYYLDIEELSGLIETSDTEVKNITSDHIIGKIRLSDEGTKSAYNSLTAAFPDPANKFEARNISFFNSTYLTIDRSVPKKGNISIPGITNYYNTRILADKYLNKSRFGLTISFNMAPRGLLLLAGSVIQIQYPRYGWIDKKFRVTSLTHQQDTTVDIVAEEYDDSLYSLSKLSKQAGTGAGGSGFRASIEAPINLSATSIDTGNETYSGVSIRWTNTTKVNTKNMYTELYSSFSPNFTILGTTISSNTITTLSSHGLVPGATIISKSNSNGLIMDKTYYVLTTPVANQLTLSENPGGSIVGLTNGAGLNLNIQTATLLATLPIPTNSYTHVFEGINGRVTKYYWVRYKVIQE
jgi:hypothetical protein